MAEAFFNLSYFTNFSTRQVIVTTNYHNHACLYADGKLVDLNSLLPKSSPWELNTAMGINDFGQIIVWGSADGGNHYRSFILTDARRPRHHPIPPGKNHLKDSGPPFKPGAGHRKAGKGRPDLMPLSRRGLSLLVPVDKSPAQ
jgi:hypothetical protein